MERELLEKAKKTMAKEPALLKLSGKIMVADDTHGDEVIAKQIVKTIRTVNQELRKKEEISFAILMLTEKEYQKLRWCPGDIIEGSFKSIGEK